MRVTSEVTSWFRQAGEWVRATGSIFKGGMKVTATSDVTPPSDPTIDPRTDAVQEPSTDVTSWKRHRGEVVRANGVQPKDGVFTNTLPSGVPPSRVTGLVVVPGDQKNDLAWDAATDDDGIAGYELQSRINRQILSLDGSYTYPDAESLQQILQTRYGIFGIDYYGKTSVGFIQSDKKVVTPEVQSWRRSHGELILCEGLQPKDGTIVIPLTYLPPVVADPIEGTFVSFSRENFTDVTFINVEIGARFVSGHPGLVVRSNNGAGAYGWSAYTAIFSETDVKIYEVVMGVLGPVKASYSGNMKNKWCTLRSEGTRISARVDDVEKCFIISPTYYNGVVGITCGPEGGEWDFGLNSYATIAYPIGKTYTDEGLTNGLEYQYRIRAVDIPGWVSEQWSLAASGIPIFVTHDAFVNIVETICLSIQELIVVVSDAPEVEVDFSETISLALQELIVTVLAAPQIDVAFAETITMAIQGLAISVSGSPNVPLATQETITLAIQNLSIVVRVLTLTPVNFSETITMSMQQMSIAVNTPVLTSVAISEIITCSLRNLTITVSPA